MIAYSWEIHPIECLVLEQGLSYVANNIPWTYTGTNEYGRVYAIDGKTKVGAPNPEIFTPFDDLTKTIVEKWLVNILDIPALQAQIEAMAEAEIIKEQTYIYLTLKY